MAYQDEARTRVLYFSGAGFVSAIIAVIAAGIVAKVFWNSTDTETRRRIFGYSFIVVFGLVCGLLVYKIDKKLAKRFNTNP